MFHRDEESFKSGSQKRAKKRRAEEAAKVCARTLFLCGMRSRETNPTKNTMHMKTK